MSLPPYRFSLLEHGDDPVLRDLSSSRFDYVNMRMRHSWRVSRAIVEDMSSVLRGAAAYMIRSHEVELSAHSRKRHDARHFKRIPQQNNL